MSKQERSLLKVGSPTHYNNLKPAEKAPEKIQIQTVEGILEYVHPKIVERLREENDRLRGALKWILKESEFHHKCDTGRVYAIAEEALQQEGGHQ